MKNAAIRKELRRAPKTAGAEATASETWKFRGGHNVLFLILILAAVFIPLAVGLAAFGVLPILVTALLGCVALVLTRCLTLDEAYAAIDWKVIFLLAGVLPLGIAMEKSGAAQFIASRTLGFVGPLGPLAVLAALYLLTAVLTETMSNNATAVLLAPIAISTATGLGVDPKPFLIAGGYRFTDFMHTGIPLNLIFWALAVYFIPKFWPF